MIKVAKSYTITRVYKDTHDKLVAIAKASGKPRIQILHRLVSREYRRLMRLGKIPLDDRGGESDDN